MNARVVRRRARITGRVQGVSFRWYTRQRADELGVVGWVGNRSDGSVVLEAEGSADAVAALLEWAHHGPPAAAVAGVDVEDVEPAGGESFEIVS